MLKHVVMWQFKEEAEGKTRAENCQYVKEQLESLPAKIPFIRKLEVFLNQYQSSMSADMILITEFDSKDDLDLYGVHPDHAKVSEYVSLVRSSRMVCDWNV